MQVSCMSNCVKISGFEFHIELFLPEAFQWKYHETLKTKNFLPDIVTLKQKDLRHHLIYTLSLKLQNQKAFHCISLSLFVLVCYAIKC